MKEYPEKPALPFHIIKRNSEAFAKTANKNK
jgi:hypothetical protein